METDMAVFIIKGGIFAMSVHVRQCVQLTRNKFSSGL